LLSYLAAYFFIIEEQKDLARILMKSSFREINVDYDAAANGLTMAERDGDQRRISFTRTLARLYTMSW